MDGSYTIDGRIDQLEQLVEDANANTSRLSRDLAEAEMRAEGWRQRAAEAVRQRDEAKAEAARTFEQIGRAEISRLRDAVAASAERSVAKPVRPTTIDAGAAAAMGVHIAITVAVAILLGMFLWNAVQMIGIVYQGGN